MDRDRGLDMAIGYIRQGLDLLDALGERGPALHLQHAIDVLTKAPIPRSEAEAEAMLGSPEIRAVAEWLGWEPGDSVGGMVEGKVAETVQASARLFGQRLKSARETAGLIQGQLSDRTGITADYISLIERGRANPTIDVMVKLAEAVGAEVWDLIVLPPTHL